MTLKSLLAWSLLGNTFQQAWSSCPQDIGAGLFPSPINLNFELAKTYCSQNGGALANGEDNNVWDVITSTNFGGDFYLALDNGGLLDCVDGDCINQGMTWYSTTSKLFMSQLGCS